MTSRGACAEAYAIGVLRQLGIAAAPDGAADDPALSWRRAGLMSVTGRPDDAGLVCPAALASAADGALLALKALTDRPDRLPLNGALLLGERARLLGLRRGGRISANGSCRLLQAADGRLALSLAREDDWTLLPALLDCGGAPDWAAVERLVARKPACGMVARGIELGMAIALDRPPAPAERLFPALPPLARNAESRPLVLDLSSLWAGPLAGSLLGMLGARVVKVEALGRPDGARLGNRRFYDLLNGGKESVALDFDDPAGRAALRRLVARADIVIEASRPRALRQLGIARETEIARGAVWVALTGHGGVEAAGRIAFGDDAAIAAGLASVMERGWGEAIFAGDAIADPLAGLHAALGAWAAWRCGGARLVEISLSETLAHAIAAETAEPPVLRDWQARAEADPAPLYDMRDVMRPAARFGADTDRILAAC
jgi:crotonobetainyl-CoA:carnitine CoA-transferase CaiB-like acyl-CoA transferase